MKNYSIAFITLLALLCAGRSEAQQQELKLWYNQPAAKWTDALPIGNGRLGAMIFGGANEDHIQFNEETLWTGRPRNYAHPGAVGYLQPIRNLLFEGKQDEAEKLGEEHFMGLKDHDPAKYELLKNDWLKKVRSDVLPSAAAYNDNNWKVMKLPLLNGWETSNIEGMQGLDGALWFRTSFNLPQAWAGKNLFIDLGRIRDVDFTYINGKQIGTSEGISTKRHYKIKASVLKPGQNQVAVQVINYFDKGGFTGVKGDQKIFVVYPEGEKPENGIPLNLSWKYWIQNDNPPPYPQYEASYQPFGDLFLQFHKQGTITGYCRELNIQDAVSKVSYTSNGVHFTREYFASAPGQVVAIHLTADRPGKISLDAILKSPHKQSSTRKIDDHTLALSVQVKDGALRGVSYVQVQAVGGKVSVSDNKINLENADEATFYLTAGTNYKNYKDVSGNPEAVCRQSLQRIAGKKYAQIKTAHINDYHRYFDTFSVNFGITKNAALPTDERIRQFSNTSDPALIALYMQYARYLLISSSRPGTNAANLQGIWNDLLTPPWGSKYTTNINLEMNYWPAEILNLSSCTQPLFKLIDEVAEAGKLTAKEHYGAPGWILHHNTDLWRGTAPINASNHGIWVGGAAWVCHHLWEHYEFTQDKDFLENEAYPIMKQAAEFYSHFLIKDPKTGWLISTPSNSPEHGGLVAGPTMDHQLIRDLFKNCISASEILNTDESFKQTLQEKYSHIAPNQIGKYGQLQEWLEDKDDTSDTHRHVSHMWGVYPGTDITWHEPNMMKAARQSLIYRGDDGTGWSLAWKVNLWARFKECDHALMLVDKLLSPAEGASGSERGGVYHNMFDAHPPFQIDGNSGGAAGIAEMLLQSQNGYIDLLPALPSALPDGEINGICARGGFVLNMKWNKGKLQQVQVLSKSGADCTLKYGSKEFRFATQKDKTYKFNGDLKQL